MKKPFVLLALALPYLLLAQNNNLPENTKRSSTCVPESDFPPSDIKAMEGSGIKFDTYESP